MRQAVYLTRECTECHGDASGAGPGKPTHALLPVEHSRLVAVVSIDIPSRIQENQLLLNRVFILSAGFLAGTLAIWPSTSSPRA